MVRPHTTPEPAVPTQYRPPPGVQLQTSPHKFTDPRNFHPNKDGDIVSLGGPYERKVQEKMEHTLVVSYKEFKDNVLPQPQVPHPTIKHTRVTALRKNLEEFFEKANWRPKEDDLAEHIVRPL